MPRARPIEPGDRTLAVLYLGPDDGLAAGERAAAWWRETHGTLVDRYRDLECRPLSSRSGFIRALTAAERVGAGTFLTPTPTSLARDLLEGALAQRVIERAGAEWQVANGITPWPTREVRRITRMLREYETLLVAPKIGVGRRRPRVRNVTGPAPWGYTRDAFGRFDPLPGAEDAIAKAVRLREDGETLQSIAAALKSLGLPWARRIHRSTVARILARARGDA